jgi:hypothetical protein
VKTHLVGGGGTSLLKRGPAARRRLSFLAGARAVKKSDRAIMQIKYILSARRCFNFVVLEEWSQIE